MYTEQIKKIMKEQGLTAKSLAAKAGMTSANLSVLLSGKHTPRLASIERIAKVLNVGMCDILTPSATTNFVALIKTESGFFSAESLSELKRITAIIESDLPKREKAKKI